MDRTQLRAIAADARDGNAKALRQFAVLARSAGFKGHAGGWISRDGNQVCQGWAALATRVVTSRGWADMILTRLNGRVRRAHPADELATSLQRCTGAVSVEVVDEPATAGYTSDRETGELLDAVLGPEPTTEVRVVATNLIPSRHLAPVVLAAGRRVDGVGRLLCGPVAAGLADMNGPVDLAAVDCLGCLDAYTEHTRPGGPVVHSSAGSHRIRSEAIKP